METPDQFRELFRMQQALNDRIGVRTGGMSEAEKTLWLLNYTRAMQQELVRGHDPHILRWNVRGAEDVAAVEAPPPPSNMQYHHADYAEALAGDGEEQEDVHQPFVRQGGKVGRNDPCPCGSGKKYKQCHGKLS